MILKEQAQFTHILEDLMPKINIYFWLSISLASTKIIHVFPVPAEMKQGCWGRELTSVVATVHLHSAHQRV